jgi:hypothetical protein
VKFGAVLYEKRVLSGVVFRQIAIEMANTGYRIKLYGHTADDREKFCTDLAVLLGVDVGIARELVDNVPVVIGRTATKEQAEHLRDRLGLIRGLCLVEAEEVDLPQVDAVAGPPLTFTPEQETEARTRRDSFLSNLWLTILIGLIGTVGLVGSGVFVAHWIRMYKENQEATVAPQKTESVVAEGVQHQPVDPEAYQKELRGRIETLEATLEQLRFQAMWQEEEMKKWYATRPLNHEEIRRSKVQRAVTEDEIKATVRELRELRAKLTGM